MKTQLAIKRLTASDLTLFEWHFRNKNAGNQKAINLNADVFVDQLFPELPTVTANTSGRMPLDLYLYGPGCGTKEQNLQRKIIKGGAYKNWRLNGEYIPDPDEQPERYHVLEPGDLAVFEFAGQVQPEAARVVFLAARVADDVALRTVLGAQVQRMAAITRSDLKARVAAVGPRPDHPIFALLATEELREAAQSGETPLYEVAGRGPGRSVSRDEMRQARQNAENIGEEGEELVNCWLAEEQASGRLQNFSWTARANAAAPYDFHLTRAGSGVEHVDAKTTTGEFARAFHLSAAELRHAATSVIPYRIYRVYRLITDEARLRISEPINALGQQVVAGLATLPAGVQADGVIIEPSTLVFGEEIVIRATMEAEEPSL
jgi:hypothetical protein